MEKCCTDLGRVGGSKVCSKGVQHDNCSESRKMNIQSWQSSEVKKNVLIDCRWMNVEMMILRAERAPRLQATNTRMMDERNKQEKFHKK